MPPVGHRVSGLSQQNRPAPGSDENAGIAAGPVLSYLKTHSIAGERAAVAGLVAVLVQFAKGMVPVD